MADDDQPELIFGPYLGTVADLISETEDEGTGLVFADGTPMPRKLPPRKILGFRPPDCE